MVASALNAFHNVYVKQVKGEEWSITAYNHPLPRTQDTKVHIMTCVYEFMSQYSQKHLLYDIASFSICCIYNKDL